MINATGTIDMQGLRYLNLFGQITRVSTRFWFMYNEIIYFLVPRMMLRKALGRDGENIKRLSEILRRRIRIIPIPSGVQHAKDFIQTIVKPVEFNDLEIKDDEIILTAGSHSKAALLGRNKRRLIEMQKIVRDFFARDFRIV